ncbi:MAG: hypothetical protein JXX28_16945 [Deltaproteobacteria bacterium]|nr:hypothetical protein [Deltaproteobacteria bacterium]
MIALLLGVALAGECTDCHTDTHHEGSRHAQSFSSAPFQAAWRRFPDRWCLECHAPSPAQREAIAPGADGLSAGELVLGADLSARVPGVSCETCHLADGVVQSATRPGLRARLAHPIVRAPDLGTEVCVGCHQFTAPGGDAWVQTTGLEHAAWTGAAQCTDCHDAHAVPGAHSDAVRSSIRAEVRREGQVVVAEISASGVGHRFPTGDPYRQLVLELGDARGLLARRVIGRSVTGMGADFREVYDGRMPVPDAAGNTALRLDLGELPATWWSLRYLLTEPTHWELAPEERGYLLAEGSLAPPAPQ